MLSTLQHPLGCLLLQPLLLGGGLADRRVLLWGLARCSGRRWGTDARLAAGCGGRAESLLLLLLLQSPCRCSHREGSSRVR